MQPALTYFANLRNPVMRRYKEATRNGRSNTKICVSVNRKNKRLVVKFFDCSHRNDSDPHFVLTVVPMQKYIAKTGARDKEQFRSLDEVAHYCLPEEDPVVLRRMMHALEEKLLEETGSQFALVF